LNRSDSGGLPHHRGRWRQSLQHRRGCHRQRDRQSQDERLHHRAGLVAATRCAVLTAIHGV